MDIAHLFNRYMVRVINWHATAIKTIDGHRLEINGVLKAGGGRKKRKSNLSLRGDILKLQIRLHMK